MEFKTHERELKTVLQEIASGEMRLPEFQRDWKWDDDHIRSLLASVSQGYPIGAVMLLESGGIHLATRYFAGVDSADHPTKSLVLDGQQRLTSLYLSLVSDKPVMTKDSKNTDIDRFYFLDIVKCMNDSDRDEAILSIPKDLQEKDNFGRTVLRDFSTREDQYRERVFPLNIALDPEECIKWEMGYSEFHLASHPDLTQFMHFRLKVLGNIQNYRVPVVELSKNTPTEAVCNVFEKVNTGGVSLNAFELITAVYAGSGFNLRQDWDDRAERLAESYEVLNSVQNTSFLTAVTLLTSFYGKSGSKGAISCKRQDVLRLSVQDYTMHADSIERGLFAAARLLSGMNIFKARDLPYATQLIPLSAICAVLGDELNNFQAKKKVCQWFWCGVLGELYGGASETRFAMDLPDVVSWVKSADTKEEPRTVRDASFAPIRLISLRTRNAAAYKGISALLIENGCSDFITREKVNINMYHDLNIDIHHIFPAKWCTENEQEKFYWDSIINKTPLTAKTNKTIGGLAPSDYLAKIESKYSATVDDMNEVLISHSIPVEALRNNDFDLFYSERATLLLNIIENAMGKKVSGRDSDEVVSEFGVPI